MAQDRLDPHLFGGFALKISGLLVRIRDSQ